MANIGTFKKVGNEFQGEIVMLTVQVKGVRIVPIDNRTNDEAPTHRVYVGRAEIGAAWPKVSSEKHGKPSADFGGALWQRQFHAGLDFAVNCSISSAYCRIISRSLWSLNSPATIRSSSASSQSCWALLVLSSTGGPRLL